MTHLSSHSPSHKWDKHFWHYSHPGVWPGHSYVGWVRYKYWQITEYQGISHVWPKPGSRERSDTNDIVNRNIPLGFFQETKISRVVTVQEKSVKSNLSLSKDKLDRFDRILSLHWCLHLHKNSESCDSSHYNCILKFESRQLSSYGHGQWCFNLKLASSR